MRTIEYHHDAAHTITKIKLRKINQKNSIIVPVDYDPGASEVNQLNRIKLMISIAKSNFEEERAGGV